MTVYHGSYAVIDAPRIIDSGRPLDYGTGFYVTTDKEQAKAWAKKVALRNNSDIMVVNSYSFNYEECSKSLSLIRFDCSDEKWLDFVCANRKKQLNHSYDIVIGPVADDSVFRVIIQYENGDIDKEYAIKKMKTETLSDQILFHTEEALKYLTFVQSEVFKRG